MTTIYIYNTVYCQFHVTDWFVYNVFIEFFSLVIDGGRGSGVGDGASPVAQG